MSQASLGSVSQASLGGAESPRRGANRLSLDQRTRCDRRPFTPTTKQESIDLTLESSGNTALPRCRLRGRLFRICLPAAGRTEAEGISQPARCRPRHPCGLPNLLRTAALLMKDYNARGWWEPSVAASGSISPTGVPQRRRTVEALRHHHPWWPVGAFRRPPAAEVKREPIQWIDSGRAIVSLSANDRRLARPGPGAVHFALVHLCLRGKAKHWWAIVRRQEEAQHPVRGPCGRAISVGHGSISAPGASQRRRTVEELRDHRPL